MKRKLVFGALVLALSGLLAFYYVGERAKASDDRVKASGTVEVTEVTVAPLIGGRILSLDVAEGDFVQEGSVVCKLSLDGLDSEESAKTAALNRERERMRELEHGSRPEEIMQARANLQAREAQLAQAERDAKRYSELLAENAVSKREAETFEENAKVQRAAVAAARQQLTLLEKGPREEQLAQQSQLLKQMEADLATTQLQISYKTIYAPISGRVLSKNYQVGEVVSPGSPIVTIGTTDDIWVKVYIPATQLERIQIGQSADIYIDSPPKNAIPGHVKSVAQEAEFNPRLSLNQQERANQVFWVKVAVHDESGRVKPGMPADVVFAK